MSCTGATIENGQFTIGTEDVNIVVTFAEKPFASLAWNDDGETNVKVGDPFTQKTLDNPDNLPVKYSSSDPSVATIDENTGVITLVAAGATEIWANFDGNDDFRPAGAKYILNVTEWLATGLAWKIGDDLVATATVTLGADDHIFPQLANPNALDVTFSSTDPTVATIDDAGHVEPLSAGTTTIQASFSGNSNYKAETVEYELTVNPALPKTYTLTLHIATEPDDGTAEIDLFKTLDFEVSDDDPDNDFVKYDGETLVMAGTFKEGTKVQISNWYLSQYTTLHWENGDKEVARFITLDKDSVITMYVTEWNWEPAISSQDEDMGTVSIIQAEVLHYLDLFDENTQWKLIIEAEPKEGYKFLGWGYANLADVVSEWSNGQITTVEEYFAALKEDLENPQLGPNYHAILEQVFSLHAEFTPQQVASEALEWVEWTIDNNVYAVKAFFTEDPDTPTGISNEGMSGEASKSLIDGRLIIIKNGIRYNAQGAILK